MKTNLYLNEILIHDIFLMIECLFKIKNIKNTTFNIEKDTYKNKLKPQEIKKLYETPFNYFYNNITNHLKKIGNSTNKVTIKHLVANVKSNEIYEVIDHYFETVKVVYNEVDTIYGFTLVNL